MHEILMLTTGGTISSTLTSEGLVPSDNFHITEMLGINSDAFNITTKNILLLDSSNIQPEEWKLIASEIYKGFDNYDSIIVTHGTDTMAYTTSMMCFMLKNPPKPVVFTGSQLPISNFQTDAITNLRCAIAMCLSKTPGIFLAFDRKIILGCRAVKVRTTGFKAFESINSRSAGVIDSRGLQLNNEIIYKYKGEKDLSSNIDSNVFLLKLTPGTNPNIIDMLINCGCHGIVIEAFGSGGISFIRRDFVSKIELALANNIPIVVCSQCLYEESNFSIYQVGKKALEKGAIEALDMTTEACVTKLMWALGQTNNIDEIRAIFSKNLAGEINN